MILRKTEPQMNADKRGFIARVYIAQVRLFLSAAPCKNQEASPPSAQGTHHVKWNVFIQVTVPGSLPAESGRLL